MTTNDGFANFATAVGAANPKTSGGTYVVECSQGELENAYRASTWFGKIVDIPADDAVREWRGWNAEADQIELIEKEEKRLQVKQKVHQALIWARLYGGSVIIPGGLPGSPSQELRRESIRKGSLQFLTVLSRHEISAQGLIRDPLSPYFGQPEYYTINTGDTSGLNVQLHPSRVIRFVGRPLPGTTNTLANGWGDSMWTHLATAIKAADGGAAIVDALMQESKIDVIKVPNLIEGMATTEYESLFLKRWLTANRLKSVSNALLLDGNDEWEQKQVTWNGLPDVLMTLLTIMAGAADIPVTRLLGTSATGLNATGEGDLKNYYDNVASQQDLKIGPQLMPLDEMLIWSALGERPDDVWYEWSPLWQPTEKERAEVDKMEAETVQIYANSGLIPPDALAKATVNRMVENGSWPGLEAAIDESDQELGDIPDIEPDVDSGGEPVEVGDAAPRTLYVRRDVLNADEIRAWAEQQGFSTILPDLHITITYSRTPVDWMKMGEPWTSELKIVAGGPRLMDQFGEARVLLINSSELSYRHGSMIAAGASYDFSDYQPHITISYDPNSPDLSTVEPYRGEIVLGPEIFEEVAL